jgi:transposase, IS5 family
MKISNNPSFADSICDVRVKKVKSVFFKQIDTLIDWRLIGEIIDKHYEKGKSATGKPSYDGLLLFKMSLLQTWYGLSDYEVEDRINDSISFSGFCGLTLEQVSPDHSTLSRFRTQMTKAGAYKKLMKEINKQLEAHQILVKTGAIVDASVIDTPLKPKGTLPIEITEEMQEKNTETSTDTTKKQIEKVYAESVDKEASWVKKAGKVRYGYKKHLVTNQEGLVLGVLTTKASVNEISNLEEVLNSVDLPKNIPLKADKGYQSEKNNQLLKTKELKNHILKKAKKNKPLTDWEKKFNKLVGKVRFKVERTFGSIKRWFNGGIARYRGIEKMHTQNLMEALSYNLYRSPGIIASNNQK